jgi:quercetin dioxygenase-like cupin family protein
MMMKKEIVLAPADPSTFHGPAFSSLLAAAERDVPVKLYYVRFEPGARTNWHAHAGAQILVVVAGRCRYQIAEEAVREIGEGSSVRFEPGVRHWHGATEAEGVEHIAINLDARDTDWLDVVTDGEYGGGPG